MKNSDAMLLHSFLRHAHEKCGMATSCIDQLNVSLTQQVPQKEESIHFWTHTFLHHSSAVSLVFWPTKSSSKSRGEKLREAVGIDSVLEALKDRALRNHIVHMDERLETWHSETPNHNLVPFIFAPRNSVGGDAICAGDILEQYVSDENIYIFRGEEFDIQALTSALNDLKVRLSEILNLHWWTPEFHRLFEHS